MTSHWAAQPDAIQVVQAFGKMNIASNKLLL
jgi:hypothetical protein